MTGRIVQEIVIEASPAVVWRHLVEREALSAWLMPTDDFEPTVGRAFTFRTTPVADWDGVARCVVQEVVPARRLAFSWTSNAIGVPTRVVIDLEEWEGRTRLRLRHEGWEALPGERRWLIDEHERGWGHLLLNGLKKRVEG